MDKLILTLLVGIIAILVINWRRKKHICVDIKKRVGSYGERIVSNELTALGQQFTVWNDITLANEKGQTAQIDHLVLGHAGIFVIETKNWSGKVYGKQTDPKWTKVLNGNSVVVTNPIQQNEWHIKILKEIITNLNEKMQYYSVIMFVGKAEPPNINNEGFVFLKSGQLVNYISNKREYLRDSTMWFIKDLISKHRVESKVYNN